MEIIVSDNKKLSDLQDVFNEQFPHLRLEFFALKNSAHPVFSKKNMITDTSNRIGEIRDFYKPGTVSFNGHQKVSTLENIFKKEHGLFVQVFRKSGNNWLETSITDNWTLAKQNKEGGKKKIVNKDDSVNEFDAYHEQV